MPCRWQAARTKAARDLSIVPSALTPLSSCTSTKCTACAAAQATASSSGNLCPTSIPMRSRSLIAYLRIGRAGLPVMLDIAADVGFPGDLDAAVEIARRFVGPDRSEIARHQRMDRDLRIAQRGIDSIGQADRF